MMIKINMEVVNLLHMVKSVAAAIINSNNNMVNQGTILKVVEALAQWEVASVLMVANLVVVWASVVVAVVVMVAMEALNQNMVNQVTMLKVAEALAQWEVASVLMVVNLVAIWASVVVAVVAMVAMEVNQKKITQDLTSIIIRMKNISK